MCAFPSSFPSFLVWDSVSDLVDSSIRGFPASDFVDNGAVFPALEQSFIAVVRKVSFVEIPFVVVMSVFVAVMAVMIEFLIESIVTVPVSSVLEESSAMLCISFKKEFVAKPPKSSIGSRLMESAVIAALWNDISGRKIKIISGFE